MILLEDMKGIKSPGQKGHNQVEDEILEIREQHFFVIIVRGIVIPYIDATSSMDILLITRILRTRGTPMLCILVKAILLLVSPLSSTINYLI